VPSDRVIVPRSLDMALRAAVTFPVAGTGGQALAHAPVQADMSFVSLAHTYTARPDPLIRTGPAELEALEMTVELADAALPEFPAAGLLAAGLLAAGAAALLLVPLLQAAASSVAAASGTPNLTGTGIRATRDFVTRALPGLRRQGLCCVWLSGLFSAPMVK
jgi:hypothetical protein